MFFVVCGKLFELLLPVAVDRWEFVLPIQPFAPLGCCGFAEPFKGLNKEYMYFPRQITNNIVSTLLHGASYIKDVFL